MSSVPTSSSATTEESWTFVGKQTTATSYTPRTQKHKKQNAHFPSHAMAAFSNKKSNSTTPKVNYGHVEFDSFAAQAFGTRNTINKETKGPSLIQQKQSTLFSEDANAAFSSKKKNTKTDLFASDDAQSAFGKKKNSRNLFSTNMADMYGLIDDAAPKPKRNQSYDELFPLLVQNPDSIVPTKSNHNFLEIVKKRIEIDEKEEEERAEKEQKCEKERQFEEQERNRINKLHFRSSYNDPYAFNEYDEEEECEIYKPDDLDCDVYGAVQEFTNYKVQPDEESDEIYTDDII